MGPRRLCVVPGDGIGPEVTSVAVEVLRAATEEVSIEYAEAGWKTFCDKGDSVPKTTLDQIRDCGAALFGAVSSPSRKVDGYQSAILKIRQSLELYANLRPVRGRWARKGRDNIDLIIVRENSEGLYGGHEYKRGDCVIAEKRVTKSASERIGRQAAMIAMANAMKTVTIVHKANVLPLTEGLFRDTVKDTINGISSEIEIREGLVDIVAYNLVAHPESFEVLVTTNMFGDILSDLASFWCGGMGRAPSLNLGETVAVAEPVHGSAPDIAGKGIADPAATILSMALLSRYYWKDDDLANRLESATIQAINNTSENSISTTHFANAVIKELKNGAGVLCSKPV